MSDSRPHVYDANLNAHSDLQEFFEDSSLVVATQFFRYETLFRQLQEFVIPWLLKKGLARRRVLRIWSAGCSDGRETYSLAMAARNAFDELGYRRLKASVRGSDVSRPQIEIARHGVYQLKTEDLNALQPYENFFDHLEPNVWRVKESLRQSVEFVTENISKVEPEDDFDILVCSLVLLYYDPDYQDAIVNHLVKSLRPDSFLFFSPARRRRLNQLSYFPVDELGPFFHRRKSGSPMAARN